MANCTTGRVVSLAVRTAKNGPMAEVPQSRVARDGGLEGDRAARPDRGITLLAQEQWHEVMRELGANLPWHTRRANLLMTGLKPAELIGERIRVGAVEIAIQGETKPCELMEQQQTGLLDALKPDCRGGVTGRILSDGTISVGDPITVLVAVDD
jgi:MOSC domain-containing protein YiiM